MPILFMLRLSEIKLPLDHTDEDLHTAVLKKLRLKAADLTSYSVFKRSYDARKRDEIRLVYIVDVETPRQKQLLGRFKTDAHVKPTPDTSYHYVAEAPSAPSRLKIRVIESVAVSFMQRTGILCRKSILSA